MQRTEGRRSSIGHLPAIWKAGSRPASGSEARSVVLKRSASFPYSTEYFLPPATASPRSGPGRSSSSCLQLKVVNPSNLQLLQLLDYPLARQSGKLQACRRFRLLPTLVERGVEVDLVGLCIQAFQSLQK